MGKVKLLTCRHCDGVMRKKRKAIHHPLKAFGMLGLGVATSFAGIFFPFLWIAALAFFIIGVYWSFGVRRLWVCTGCGSAIERA
ncbi:MAG: hypothetical protein RX316_02115 [bacterium]|nr:hypothetical protein [bacterium]